MNRKHFSFEERIIIEECVNKRISVHQIALRLGRPDSSVVREIKRNRTIVYDPPRDWCDGILGDKTCFKRFSDDECERSDDEPCKRDCCRNCSIMCNKEKCPDYRQFLCDRLKKSPYVCNGCDDHCHHTSPKYKYYARKAELLYREKLHDARAGVSLSSTEMELLDNLVSPLLLQGQSIRAIYMTHRDEIPCSESTLYEYVDRCYLTARNIDMPRKVRFKPRYNHGPRPKSFQGFVAGRTYSDFSKYLEDNPDANIWEMDTVIGTPGGKCLLTLLFRKSHLMLAYLLDNHTQEAVITALNRLCDAVGIETFQRLFQVIITDRGLEFGNPYAMECDINGEIKTRVFYCDPYCSWQKGMIEKNHEFIRMVLPKGKSFDSLSQTDIHLMMNHINNYPRESLNGATPFELSKLLLGKEFLEAIQYHKVHPDDVILRPRLLRKPIINN